MFRRDVSFWLRLQPACSCCLSTPAPKEWHNGTNAKPGTCKHFIGVADIKDPGDVSQRPDRRPEGESSSLVRRRAQRLDWHYNTQEAKGITIQGNGPGRAASCRLSAGRGSRTTRTGQGPHHHEPGRYPRGDGTRKRAAVPLIIAATATRNAIISKLGSDLRPTGRAYSLWPAQKSAGLPM